MLLYKNETTVKMYHFFKKLKLTKTVGSVIFVNVITNSLPKHQ
jgi:hypothetical protein